MRLEHSGRESGPSLRDLMDLKETSLTRERLPLGNEE